MKERHLIVVFSMIAIVAGFGSGALSSLLIHPSPSLGQTTPPPVEKPIEIRKEITSFEETTRQTEKFLVRFVVAREIDKGLVSVPLKSEIRGFGVLLTSDGLIVTHKNVLRTKNLRVILSDGRSLPISEAKTDPTTNLVFVRVLATNLSAAQFATGSIGEDILVPVGLNLWKQVKINGTNYSEPQKTDDLIQSSEVLEKFLTIVDESPNFVLGSPAFNNSGALVGLMTADSRINNLNERAFVPSAFIDQAMKSIFKNNEVRRPLLGLTYVDYAEVGAAYGQAGLFGARVIDPNASKENHQSESPAKKAGFLSGDVIKKVEDENINGERNLLDHLLDFNPGQTIQLTIDRAGKEIILKAVLGTLVGQKVL